MPLVPTKYKSLTLIKNQLQYTPTAVEDRLSIIKNCLIRVQCKNHGGSGLLITQDGFFVTNAHVLSHKNMNEGVKIFFITNNPFGGGFPLEEICIVDSYDDITLAKVTLPSELCNIMPTGIHMMRDENIQKETPVSAFALFEEPKGFVEKKGVFQFCRHPISHIERVERSKRKVFHTSVHSQQGFSGGPVINTDSGQIIGITTMSTTNQPLMDIMRMARHFNIPQAYDPMFLTQAMDKRYEVKGHDAVTSRDILIWINTFLKKVSS